MKTITQDTAFLLIDVSTHNEIKPLVVNAITSMGKFSYINESQSISNTDWHLASNFNRPYYPLVVSALEDVALKINSFFGYPEPLVIQNYWFQWYEKNDYHRWHIHPKSIFNAVYFLSLPDGASKTTLKLHEKEFSVDVKEGQVLVFPAMYLHCSKPNKSDAPKIVISFNL